MTTIHTGIELSVERPAHTFCRIDVRQLRSIAAPFLISVSLHLLALWTFSHVVRAAPHHPPMLPIEVDIVTPVPVIKIPLAQARHEPKAAVPVRQLQLPRQVTTPVSTPLVTAPRPTSNIDQMNQVREPVRVADRGAAVPQAVSAATATSQKPSVTAPQADTPVIGPSYDAAYLSNPPPPYPAAARRLKVQGTVTVRVMVSADGRPTSVTLEKGSGTRILDEAALEAVQHWSFVPARRGDKAIAAVVDVPVRFRLN